MKVLITGGSGFIGSHLIGFLLAEIDSISILNIDLKESKILDSRLTTEIADIRSTDFPDKLNTNSKFDLCIHLAALCKEPGFEWEEYFNTNHLGTSNVIKLCERLSVPKIIFTSTMMVYKAGEIKRTEKSITAADTAYGISKLLAEKELLNWETKDLSRKVRIIRPAVVFGENENANFTRLYRSLKSGFFPYVGKSSTIKSCIYVKELIQFIWFLFDTQASETTFNLAFTEDQRMSKIIQAFKKVFGFKSFNPILPYWLLLFAARFFEMLNSIGIKNHIHHRRIQKLYYSTHIFPENAIEAGYKFSFGLESSLEDWKNSNDPNILGS